MYPLGCFSHPPRAQAQLSSHLCLLTSIINSCSSTRATADISPAVGAFGSAGNQGSEDLPDCLLVHPPIQTALLGCPTSLFAKNRTWKACKQSVLTELVPCGPALRHKGTVWWVAEPFSLTALSSHCHHSPASLHLHTNLLHGSLGTLPSLQGPCPHWSH